MKTRDLIRRLGWEAFPYLTSIGPILEGNVYFVDSGATNATDAADGEHGNSWDMPFATLDYAVGRCTASQGDLILLQQGHAEDLSATNVVDVDVAGVTILGMGTGEDRPTFTYDHADALFTIGASNVTIKGLRFMPSVTIVTNAISVETTLQGILIEDCEFAPGEKGDGTDEFVDALSFVSTDDDCIVRKCTFRTHSACDGVASAITTLAACDRMLIEDNIFVGAYGTAAIKGVAADLECIIRNNIMKVTDGEPGIELHANTTGIIANNLIESTGVTADVAIVAADCSWFDNKCVAADGGASVIIGGGEVTTETAAALVAIELDHVAATDTTVAADGDLTTYCADGSLLAHIMSATANTSTFKATTDSLEAISVAVAAYTDNVAAAVAEPPTAKSLQDTLHKDGSYTYDNTTDSLEAIRDYMAAGTGVTVALDADQLDHLAGADTTVAADGDLSTYIKDGSSLCHVMTKGADTSDYAASTDSLEALSDKFGGFSGDGGAAQDDSVKASLDLLNTDTAAILADTAAIQPGAKMIATSTLTDWGAADATIFTVANGPVKCKLWGEVLQTVKATPMDLSIQAKTTAPGTDVVIASTLECNADAIGTIYKMNATFGSAMVAVTAGCTDDSGVEFILPPGVLEFRSATAEDGGGSIKWYLQYEPLLATATVTGV